MNVYLDDTLLEVVDLYTQNEVYQNPVYSTSFPYGQHTIKMEWTGTSNQGSSGTTIFLDKMTYIDESPVTPTPSATSTPTSTPTQTPMPTPTNSYVYDRNDAVNYADTWAHSRNTAYPRADQVGCECNNCTNFASQVLHEGGYPLREGQYEPLDGEEWWYKPDSLSEYSWTWWKAESFKNYMELYAYPGEFELKTSKNGLAGGDFIVLDICTNGELNCGDPDGIPDHVRVVVGEGYTSTNPDDYANPCTTATPTVPASINALLINQNCVDRWHVKWDYNIEYLVGSDSIWYFHVIE